MTDPDQLADEAIDVRARSIRRTVARHTARNDAGPEAEAMCRLLATVDFYSDFPVLDGLATQREIAIAELAERGITPDYECSAFAASGNYLAVPDDRPLHHRYRILQVGKQIAVGWLVTTPGWNSPGRYTVRIGEESIFGTTLHEALQRLADLRETRAGAGDR